MSNRCAKEKTYCAFFAEKLVYLLSLKLVGYKMSKQYEERSTWYGTDVQIFRKERPQSRGGGQRLGQRLVLSG